MWLAGAVLPGGADLTPEEILATSDRLRGGHVPGVTWTIRVEARVADEVHTRDLVVIATRDAWLAEFLKPLKVKGQKMLMRGRNMWFFQPGVSRPVPLSPRQRLLGEVAYGDIASTNYAIDYRGRIVGREEVGGEECYVLDLEATEKNATYDRIRYWVSTRRLMGLKAEFFAVSGKPLKTATFEYANSIVFGGQHLPFISRMQIVDPLKGTDTVLEYTKIKVGVVPAETFDLNLMMR